MTKWRRMTLAAPVVQTVWMLVPRWRVPRMTLCDWALARRPMTYGSFVQVLNVLSEAGLVHHKQGDYWLADKSLWTVPGGDQKRTSRALPVKSVPALQRAVKLANGNLTYAARMTGYSYRTLLTHCGEGIARKRRTRRLSNQEIATAVAKYRGTRTAARALGISRNTIQRALRNQRAEVSLAQ